MHDPTTLDLAPSIPKRRIDRQFLKSLFHPNLLPQPANPPQRNEKQLTTLPLLQKNSHSQSASLVILKRSEIEHTISMLKLKHFGPHGASRAHKLELIKSKRGAQRKQSPSKPLPPMFPQVSGSGQGEPEGENIVGCSLEESIFFG